MSHYLDRLLDGELVEWRALGEVFDLRNGYTPSKAVKEYWVDGDIPWFRMEDLRANGGVLSDSILHVHKDGIKGKLFPANSIIMSTTATIGEHAIVTVDYMSNQQFTNFTLKHEFCEMLDMKFVYYYFFILDEQAKQSVNQSNFPSVQMSALRKFQIPIPCPDKPEKSLQIQG
ncbi:MAG: restriction endonuclease subunit S, partial [Gammaproteobacteria bacterium]|nr:restriction endonuclease subunit S [Gammaproteobacteria bacterium]